MTGVDSNLELSRHFFDTGTITGLQSRRALPILVRQARTRHPITYGDLAREIESHHRPIQRYAGHIGSAIRELGALDSWRNRRPPPIQVLIINKRTGLPSKGVDSFLQPDFRSKERAIGRGAALAPYFEEIFAYPNWEEVMAVFSMKSASTAVDELNLIAARGGGVGGEGLAHRALKEHVAANPNIVGLGKRHPLGKKEYALASGDAVDVVFEHNRHTTAVEVKSHTSNEADIVRGIYQCIKYRAVLQAQSAVSQDHYSVEVALVLGAAMPRCIRRLAVAHGVRFVENVKP